jgi:hypothetical protein
MEQVSTIVRKPFNRVACCLLLVVLLGAGLRLYHLAAESLWFDECASLYISKFVDSKASILDTKLNGEPPMNAILTKVWYNGVVRHLTHFPVTSAKNDFLIRLMPCLLGILAIPLVFLVTRYVLKDPWAGVIAAYLFAISPFQIRYAQELRIYAFFIILAFLAMYCMAKALEENRAWAWFGMVFLLVLMVYSHYFSVWVIFSFNVYYLCTIWPNRRHFWRWTIANLCILTLIAFALRLAFVADKFLQSIPYPWYPKPTWKTGFITFKNLMAGFGPSVWAYWPLFLIMSSLFLLGVAAQRRRWTIGAMIAILTLVPIAFNVVIWSQRNISFYEDRWFIFSGAVALMGIAAGLRAVRTPWFAGIGLAAITFFTLPCLNDYYAHRLHPILTHRVATWDKVDFRGASAYLQPRLKAGDLVAFSSHFMGYSLKHYLDWPNLCRLSATDPDEREHGNPELVRSHGLMPIRMDIGTRDAQRVWFFESFGTTFEHKPITQAIRKWLDENWTVREQQTFDGLSVTLYERKQPNPSEPPVAAQSSTAKPGS